MKRRVRYESDLAWLAHNMMRESVFSALTGADKVPYTDQGIGVIAAALRAMTDERDPELDALDYEEWVANR